MSIVVCGLHDVMDNIQDADVIISIMDDSRDRKKCPLTNVSHVPVNFRDTEHPSESEWLNMMKCVSRVLAKVNDTITLDSKIVVHCHAGVSRSSAIAWLILIKLGMDYKDAFTLLFKQHPNIWPNKVVLSIGARILSLPPEFGKFVDQVDFEIASLRTEYLGYGG